MVEVVTVAVPFPVIGLPGVDKVWGIVCPEHPTWPGGAVVPTDRERSSAEAFAAACACAHPGHKRKRTYSTASETGMELIANRWVYAGDKGYRVRPNGDGTFRVVSYAHTTERPVGSWALSMGESEAHEYAARMARTIPHPVEG
jgi:hypothetical protein